jgi:hypothetical protein
MLAFMNFLSEAKSAAIPHLTHLAGEEHLYSKDRSDEELIRLENMHRFLKGEKTSVDSVGVKADGSPSFEMGYATNPHTQEKEFGVAYKGAAKGYAFDQNMIDRNFGHSEGLHSKMSQLLEHGRKIISPLHGIVQGDFMGSKKDGTIQKQGNRITHKENTITYGYGANEDEGKKLSRAKISVALHTRLNEDGSRKYNLNKNIFYEHPDVHLWNGTFSRSNVNYKEDHHAEFEKHFRNAKEKLSSLRDHDGLVEGHSEHLQTYINKTVREGSNPSAEGYKSHLKDKLQKDIDKVKTPAAKQRKTDFMENMVDHVDENKQEFNKLFSAHKSLDNAKMVLLRSLESSGQNQEHTINGIKTQPEGFVVSFKDGTPRKIINRSKEGFSGLNLNK